MNFRRAFSSKSYELGATLEANALKDKKFHFFRLESLNSFDEAISEPEGSVACVPINGQTQYETILKRFEKVEASNARLEADVKTLKFQVKQLQVTPAVLQVCETIKFQERYLIKKYLPIIYAAVPSHKQRYIADKDTSDTINQFFKIHVVKMLNTVVETDEFEKVSDYRNDVAHEALFEQSIIGHKWDQVREFFNFKKYAIIDDDKKIVIKDELLKINDILRAMMDVEEEKKNK